MKDCTVVYSITLLAVSEWNDLHACPLFFNCRNANLLVCFSYNSIPEWCTRSELMFMLFIRTCFVACRLRDLLSKQLLVHMDPFVGNRSIIYQW